MTTINLTTTNTITLVSPSNTITLSVSGDHNVSSIPSDTKFYLDGPNGSTYLIYNSTLDRVELWKNDIIQHAW